MAETWQHRSMRDILRVVFSRWLTAVAIIAIVIGAAAAATWYLPKVYEAQARLTAPMTIGEQTLAGDIRTDTTFEVRMKMQHDVLTGGTVLSRVLARADNLKLVRDNSPGSASAISEAGLKIATGQQERLKQFRRNVRMETTGGEAAGKSLSFTLLVRSESASQAKLLADLLTEEFKFRYQELIEKQLKERYDASQKDLAEMQKSGSDYVTARDRWVMLVNKYKSLADFATAMSLLNKGPNTDVGTGRTETAAREDYLRCKSELEGVAKLRKHLDDAVTVFDGEVRDGKEISKLPFIPTEFATQPAISRICENLADKYGKRAELASQYTVEYEPLKQLRLEITGLQGELSKLFKSELAGLVAREDQLSAKLAVYSGVFGGDPPKVEKVEELGVQVTALQEAEAAWSNQRQLLQDQEGRVSRALRDYHIARQHSPVETIDGAVEPDRPIRPIVWLNLLIGAIVGVLLALTYLFLADYYDHSVRSTDDVERYLGVPVLASVDRMIRRPVQ